MPHLPRYPENTPLARALDVVGSRWTLLIIDATLGGTQRFDDLHRRLGIARNVLARRLTALTEAGLLERRRYGTHSERFAYIPTSRAEGLAPVLEALGAWSDGLDRPSQPGAPASRSRSLGRAHTTNGGS